MPFKIVGVIVSDNLRYIILFKSDLKFSNKIYFGIKLIKTAESSGILPQEQHGSRSVHTPINVSYSKACYLTM